MSEQAKQPTETVEEPLTAAGLLEGDEVVEAEQPEVADEQKPEEPSGLKVPGKDATPEEWAEFYAQLGRPEDPDGYELPVPEGDDGSFAKEMAPLLHKHGLSAEQAKGLAEDWNAYVASKQAEVQKAEDQRIAALHAKNTQEAKELETEWGTNHEANMHFAKQSVKQFFPKEKAGHVVAAIESVLGYKGAIQFLHNIGKNLGESDAAGLGDKNSSGKRTAAQILYGDTSGNA